MSRKRINYIMLYNKNLHENLGSAIPGREAGMRTQYGQEDVNKYKKFKKVDGATYRKVNQLSLRENGP
jgi:hypothetical protein